MVGTSPGTVIWHPVKRDASIRYSFVRLPPRYVMLSYFHDCTSVRFFHCSELTSNFSVPYILTFPLTNNSTKYPSKLQIICR